MVRTRFQNWISFILLSSSSVSGFSNENDDDDDNDNDETKTNVVGSLTMVCAQAQQHSFQSEAKFLVPFSRTDTGWSLVMEFLASMFWDFVFVNVCLQISAFQGKEILKRSFRAAIVVGISLMLLLLVRLK